MCIPGEGIGHGLREIMRRGTCKLFPASAGIAAQLGHAGTDEQTKCTPAEEEEDEGRRRHTFRKR